MNILKIQQEWFGNVKGDILSGIVVALALIPEAIAFSIIAGVDPMVGLYASFSIALVIAFVGGRPGMISGATGAMALLMVNLVAEHGLQYLLAATILTGIIQILFGILKLARMMKFVPRSVMIGFVNALAIMIFTSQLQHFVGETWIMYALVALTLAIIYLLPRFTKAIPSTLVAIVVVTAIVIIGNINVGTVGDMGIITQQLPVFLIPDIPLTMETLLIILPYSFSLAIVGLVESLLTANIVDDMTDTESNKNKESRGQGIANIVTGFFGGMGGCAMIGQSVINVKSGGSGRLSSLVAGVVLMSMIIILGEVVVQIPMAALAGVMIMVSISTFDWSSLKNLVKIPKTDSAVMLTTIIIVLATHNLAIGVLAGVLLSAIFFAAKISKVKVTEGQVVQNQKKTYRIEGQLFFASVSDLPSKFYFGDTITEVEIDLTQAHLWDDSAIGALDKIEAKFAQNNINVNYIGLNEESKQLKKRIGGISNAAGH
ncbi:MAG: SulP family inorganic anion transporter [Bacillota bacterium]|uniref:SulP family inorganic anion transporter n=1 Tax=Virgibacillus salarius TaxID=447199 RepID=A0A941E3C4_9BACI|nr:MULTISPECIES: SulP family inorganic anion transporter [Bacillaceae]NAZ10791.1 sodium-independent anion transporter [Agaribacter marinus]MBR7798083.1 SulP family inorganic anion transporter [Virgibacillus salarius]MCC2252580.1 SulP family inorganic anion transporter [Virgibacillus sp. AGTR]QRZ17227.1 SulP family inorganic anion transporter [Virgibacillus sp. AGTR]WBX79488.1 SulP family inorganic anion transporter [Virgibacillus salarius]